MKTNLLIFIQSVVFFTGLGVFFMLAIPFFSFTQPMMCVCVWRDPFMVYVSEDEKSVQGREVRKKIEDGEKRKIKNA